MISGDCKCLEIVRKESPRRKFPIPTQGSISIDMDESLLDFTFCADCWPSGVCSSRRSIVYVGGVKSVDRKTTNDSYAKENYNYIHAYSIFLRIFISINLSTFERGYIKITIYSN